MKIQQVKVQTHTTWRNAKNLCASIYNMLLLIWSPFEVSHHRICKYVLFIRWQNTLQLWGRPTTRTFFLNKKNSTLQAACDTSIARVTGLVKDTGPWLPFFLLPCFLFFQSFFSSRSCADGPHRRYHPPFPPRSSPLTGKKSIRMYWNGCFTRTYHINYSMLDYFFCSSCLLCTCVRMI